MSDQLNAVTETDIFREVCFTNKNIKEKKQMPAKNK